MRINPWRMFHGAFVPNWLMLRTEVTQGAKLAYSRLSEYAGVKGFAFPGEKTLATSLGVEVRQCKRYVAELIAFKLIETERQGMGKTQMYYFLSHPWMSLPSGDVYDTSEGSYVSPPIIKDSLEKTQLSTTKKGFQHVIPELMGLTPERRERAISCGLPEVEVEHQWSRFVTHYRSTGQKRVDWDLAWDNWCDNFRPHPPSSAAPPSPHLSGQSTFLQRKWEELNERERDRPDSNGREVDLAKNISKRPRT